MIKAVRFNLYSSMNIFSRRQTDNSFLIFPRKQILTLHANCLQWRQFAWNVITRFLGKIRKIFLNVVCWILLPRVHSVKNLQVQTALNEVMRKTVTKVSNESLTHVMQGCVQYIFRNWDGNSYSWLSSRRISIRVCTFVWRNDNSGGMETFGIFFGFYKEDNFLWRAICLSVHHPTSFLSGQILIVKWQNTFDSYDPWKYNKSP